MKARLLVPTVSGAKFGPGPSPPLLIAPYLRNALCSIRGPCGPNPLKAQDPLRILHIVPTYLPAIRYGGPIYSVHGLCAGLARRGHDVHVYTTNVDGPGVSPVPLHIPLAMDGVKVTYFPTSFGRRLYRSPSMGAALRKRLATFNVVHLHSVFLWPTTAAAVAARRRRVPYVLSPRGMLVPELIDRKSRMIKTGWIRLFERRNLAAAAAVHVTSEIEAEGIGRLGLLPPRIAVIPNGIELPPSSANFDSTSPTDHLPKPRVLCLGRINWKKGLERLIPAMARVPGAHLIVAGNDEEGYVPYLKALAEQSCVLDRTHFIGPIYDAQKWKVLATTDVFVLPSYSENFGIAVLEAMAAGVPVVVTPEVGLAQVVAAKNAGVVVDGDADEIGDAIARLLADPSLRRRMGEAGRETAVTQFSWPAVAERMEWLYADLSPVSAEGAFS